MSLNAKGFSIRLFTVDNWVAGDLMLSAKYTVRLLVQRHLNTGHTETDAVLESVMAHYHDEIRSLLSGRNEGRFHGKSPGMRHDEGFEILSGIAIDLHE